MVESAEPMITTDQLVAYLLDYGRVNSIASVTDATAYLAALADRFRDRPARGITASDLHEFHSQMSATPAAVPLLTLLDKKSNRWEAAYSLRAEGVVDCLQWESSRPVRALVEVFERPDVRPRRVLELGCGDGVNSIFMASRGCDVTAVDIAPTALRMAHQKARKAGVEIRFMEGDVFDLSAHTDPYDFVFDRGMFHHVPVFRYDDYKQVVTRRLTPGGWLHLICHHVSTRPTMLLDSLCGFVGKLLGFVTGVLVETGAGFTVDEVESIFSDRFVIEAVDLIWDDNNRPLRFVSALMRHTA
jgi:SAM-dependent methyltransferase